MAAKKAAAKTTALVPWDKKFAEYATESKEQVKNIVTGGLSLKFGHNSIEVGGSSLPGGRVECIILGTAALNAWYRKAYDSNDVTIPDCYAMSSIADDPDMAPHVDAPDKQAALCADCPKNEFGTAKVGRGKECGNNLRLAVILGKDAKDADGVVVAEMATAKISPTNMKHYKGYLDSVVEEHGRPLWAVVTEITSHDDKKTQIRLEFKMVDLIEDDDILLALEKRYKKIRDEKLLLRPYAPLAEKPKKPTTGKSSKFAGKKAR
jgi:hypothetical protein